MPLHAATCANALTHLSRRVPWMRAGPFIGKSPSTTGRQEPFSPPEAVTDLLIALSLCQLWRPPPSPPRDRLSYFGRRTPVTLMPLVKLCCAASLTGPGVPAETVDRKRG